MIEAVAKSSPKTVARVAGVLMLTVICGGIFAQAFVSDNLIVRGNAAATANNILTNQGWIRAAFSVYLVEMAAQILYSALIYKLLKPAGPTVALAAAFIDLSGSIIKTFSRVFFLLPLTILGSPWMSSFNADQVQAIALLALETNRQGPWIALAFFGLSGLLNGYLILRSTFLPRWLGAISLVSGLGWMTYFYPPLGSQLFMFIVLIALIGSAAKIFWFVVFGVDEKRWKERANSMAMI